MRNSMRTLRGSLLICATIFTVLVLALPAGAMTTNGGAYQILSGPPPIGDLTFLPSGPPPIGDRAFLPSGPPPIGDRSFLPSGPPPIGDRSFLPSGPPPIG